MIDFTTLTQAIKDAGAVARALPEGENVIEEVGLDKRDAYELATMVYEQGLDNPRNIAVKSAFLQGLTIGVRIGRAHAASLMEGFDE